MINFNPMSVMMGKPSNPLQPYVPTAPIKKGVETPNTPPAQGRPVATLAPESVRATGTGPFDPAYRQNLATFAGGLFGRPGGTLGFNPTSKQPFGGAQVGGGNSPLFGMPSTQNEMAIGGNPFSFTPPTPTENAMPAMLTMVDWLKQFTDRGRNMRADLT